MKPPFMMSLALGLTLKGILKCRLDWAIPEKNQMGGGAVGDILIQKKNPRIFHFFYFTLGNSEQNKAPPMKIPQNCVTNLCYIRWKFQGQNPRPLEIPHDFFLITPGNSTSFLINYFGKAAKVS